MFSFGGDLKEFQLFGTDTENWLRSQTAGTRLTHPSDHA
jgi:hypothetical protein